MVFVMLRPSSLESEMEKGCNGGMPLQPFTELLFQRLADWLGEICQFFGTYISIGFNGLREDLSVRGLDKEIFLSFRKRFFIPLIVNTLPRLQARTPI